MKEEIEAVINKSQRALNSAGREFKAGDYSFSLQVAKEDAQNCISKAEETFKVISKYLEKKITEKIRK